MIGLFCKRALWKRRCATPTNSKRSCKQTTQPLQSLTGGEWPQKRFGLLKFLSVKIQGSEDAQDALSCMSLFAKEPLIIGLFCGKWPMEIKHPICLYHPVDKLAFWRFHLQCMFYRKFTSKLALWKLAFWESHLEADRGVVHFVDADYEGLDASRLGQHHVLARLVGVSRKSALQLLCAPTWVASSTFENI